MIKSRQIAKITIFIIGLFIIFIGVTYGFVQFTLIGEKKQVITAGTLQLVLEEDENNLTINDALPIADEVGMIGDAFTFHLFNKGYADVRYIIKLAPINTGNNLSLEDVKYGLEKDDDAKIDFVSNMNDFEVDAGVIRINQTINYKLRLWIREDVMDDSVLVGKNLSFKIGVETSQIIVDSCMPVQNKVDGSGANAPILASGMIPVVYDECEKVWKKADIKGVWYNYENQNWANAVTVTETNRETYINAIPGTTIPMNDINTMWVWIPRYEYQYTNLGNAYAGGTKDLPGEIKVNFIKKNQLSPSDINTYKIPEGFTFGDENLSGFWMGKFETTGSITSACINEECKTADVTVKPNMAALANQKVSSMFYASRAMQNASNAKKYGFDFIGNKTMDVHMAKNTEWGLVSYLSQSKYGKYGNPDYTGANKEIYANNSSFLTGKSNGLPGNTNVYPVDYNEKDVGYGASTTGTIYGVYDMSGGTYEYVMGNLKQISGQNATANSGFCGNLYDGTVIIDNCAQWPEGKYYDLYTASTEGNQKAGDATYETSAWYGDTSGFVWANVPWFRRGQSRGTDVILGTFAFGPFTGTNIGHNGFRLIIKP